MQEYKIFKLYIIIININKNIDDYKREYNKILIEIIPVDLFILIKISISFLYFFNDDKNEIKKKSSIKMIELKKLK